MKSVILAIALSLTTSVISTARAADAAAGKTKAAACIACHGEDGVGTIDIYPNLAGQKQAYLVSAIKAYKNGQRTGGLTAVMQPMVGTLSDDDIADIAAYYSGL